MGIVVLPSLKQVLDAFLPLNMELVRALLRFIDDDFADASGR